jgi:hypothetical protein
MQPLKSMRAAVVVAPAVTASAILVASLLVVWVGGEQIAALDVGLIASASTVYRTGAAAGATNVTLPAENVPTFGLLAGTTKV